MLRQRRSRRIHTSSGYCVHVVLCSWCRKVCESESYKLDDPLGICVVLGKLYSPGSFAMLQKSHFQRSLYCEQQPDAFILTYPDSRLRSSNPRPTSVASSSRRRWRSSRNHAGPPPNVGPPARAPIIANLCAQADPGRQRVDLRDKRSQVPGALHPVALPATGHQVALRVGAVRPRCDPVKAQ